MRPCLNRWAATNLTWGENRIVNGRDILAGRQEGVRVDAAVLYHNGFEKGRRSAQPFVVRGSRGHLLRWDEN